MDIVERLRSLKSDEYIENLVGKAADEIERLREQVDFERASLQAAFGELRKLDGDIERLRQRNAELVEEIKKLKQAKEVNKYDTHYPDDGFGGYPSVYNRR